MTSMYSLSWDNFGNNIASKFSALQQNGELVDMTIAAEGHSVKVHQVIMCCASPYIRELVRSIPCPNPVVFLNNVSYPTLSNILQYVYTGEVTLTEEGLPFFLQAARALQIQGIGMQNIECPTSNTGNINLTVTTPGLHKVKLNVPTEYKNTNIPAATKKSTVFFSPQKSTPMDSSQIIKRVRRQSPSPVVRETVLVDDNTYNMDNQNILEDNTLQTDMLEDTTTKIVKDNTSQNYRLSDVVDNEDVNSASGNSLRYTVSNRGSLQLILNRYIYNLFSKSKGGQVMKWRCVDYKGQKCPACTVTNNEVVVKRIALHNHSYHDKKIIDKINKKAVYSSIRPAELNKND